VLCIRPEKWRATAPDLPDVLQGRIIETRYAGDRIEFTADTPVGRIAVVEISRHERRIGDRVGLTVDACDVRWVV
jgi:hypothetical protein